MVVVGTNAKVGRLPNAGKNLVTHNRVLLYLGKFLVGKPSFLVDYVPWNTDFSYVVKKACIVNLVALFL